MEVEIVFFPATKIATIEHRGPPELEHETLRKLIAWRIRNGYLDPARYRSYGIHYTDPFNTPPAEHRVDFGLSVDHDIEQNAEGIVVKAIPPLRCARARDIGSRFNNQAAPFLYHVWLPQSGETPGAFPTFFHYVNVGPDVRAEDMVTDVYLPLQG